MANYGTRYEKKETPYGLYAALLVVMLLAGYVLSGLYVAPYEGIENWQKNFIWALTHPVQDANEKTPAILCVAFILWILLMGYITYYYRNFHSSLEHGDARWLEPEEADAELADADEKYNRIVSENVRVSLRGALSNNNMIVMGSSGSGKTTALMHQNLLQFNGSYVVLDVKGDTQRKLGNAMIQAGYTVKSVNFKDPRLSDRYNPFEYIEREDDLLRVIEALHKSCRPKNEMSAADPFWDDAVDLYFSALFYYEWLDKKERGQVGTMNGVLELCNMEAETVPDPETGENTTRLQLLMNRKAEIYGPDYPPVRDYMKLKGGAPDTVASVILMINGMLRICETAEVRRIFEANDINIRELGTGVGGDVNRPVCLFLCIPDSNWVYNWIISMFYTQMFDILFRLSDDELKKPLPVQLDVWMDEFYAGARPADPEVLMGVCRSRNVNMIPMLQSVSQLKTLFKEDKWEVYFDVAATVVYLGSGPAAKSTHEFISALLAETTADSRTDNVHLGNNGNSGINFARTGIKLMTPEQVKRMPQTECIVFFESRPPVYDNKAFPFDRPKMDFVAKKWLRERYEAALSLGDYVHPVRVLYDPVHFHYITVRQEQPLAIIEDEEEIQKYQKMADADPSVYQYHINRKELLYLSWGNRKSAGEVEAMYKKALEAQNLEMEKIKGLSVLSDMPVPDFGTLPATDKSGWDKNAGFAELLGQHWQKLPQEEKEELALALDDGLSEEQLKELLFMELPEMVRWHRAYKIRNGN